MVLYILFFLIMEKNRYLVLYVTADNGRHVILSIFYFIGVLI